MRIGWQQFNLKEEILDFLFDILPDFALHIDTLPGIGEGEDWFDDLAVGDEETQNILITEFLDFALDKFLQWGL